MTAPTPSRRPLAEIELTGGRRGVRQGALLLMAIVAGVSGLASLCSSEVVGAGLIVGPAELGLAVSAARARRHRYPRGLQLGAVTTLLGPVALVMLTLTLHGGIADPTIMPAVMLVIAVVGTLALIALGPLLFFAELLTSLAERARLRREADPVFPTARVVER